MTTIIAGPPKRPRWIAGASAGGMGALLGLKFGGPPGAVAGAIVGALGGYFLEGAVAAEAQKLLHLVHPSSFQANAAGAPVSTVAQNVAQNGLAKTSAAALYAYLKVHGPDGTSDLAELVSAFQSQSNSDPQALGLTGPLGVSGVYDPKTSAALSLYTHDPIPPATPPAAQPLPSPTQVADVYLPGAAATSGFNLFTYLQGHGGNKATDGAQNKLVHQFQIDVNTDPKFPGPAGVVGNGILKILVTSPLGETGAYDAQTAAALAILSGTLIKP